MGSALAWLGFAWNIPPHLLLYLDFAGSLQQVAGSFLPQALKGEEEGVCGPEGKS